MTNTIIRAPRRHRFVIIDQHAIEDTRSVLGSQRTARLFTVQAGRLEGVSQRPAQAG